MATTEDQPSLVIIGSWNPAILNPEWLVREIYQNPEDTDTPVTMEFATKPGMPPRFTIEGTSFVPANDRLMINPQNIEEVNLRFVEDKAIVLLNILSHTPVLAFGQNFEFIESEPSDELLSDITAINGNVADHVDGKELVTSRIITSHEINSGLLHFTRVYSRGSMSLKFNFHYDVSTANEAAEKMNGTFVNNLNIVKGILNTYNTEINEVLDE